jgi:hypothetical protein
VTKIAVGIVELLPSLLLNCASGPQIAVMKTATHMDVIASDVHASGMSCRNHQRVRSPTGREGPCEIVDKVSTSFHAQPSPVQVSVPSGLSPIGGVVRSRPTAGRESRLVA